jgi:peptide/nickel transport system permease protein
MWQYTLRRIFQAILVMFSVTLITFIALHAGGDPTFLYVSERASPQVIAETRHKLGFDRPLYQQYLSFVGNLLHGSTGKSLTYHTSAMKVVLGRFPATIEITLLAMLIAVTLAIPFGIISAIRRGTAVDGGVMLIAMLGQSMPDFWLGIMLILFVGVYLHWLPISGRIPFLDPLFQGHFAQAIENFPNALRHMLMPASTIAVFSLSRNARLVRSSMLEVLSQDYVRTARSKGLKPWRVILRHAFRNALIPVVTMVGLEFGFLLSGIVVVETVFAWPGVGRLVFNAINHRDIPLVEASVILFSVIFVGLNLIVDLLYAVLDPRVRLE